MSDLRDDTANPSSGTVGELVEWLAPGVLGSREPLAWPPDAFAVVASILLKSGAYLYVVDPASRGTRWPPGSSDADRANWASRMRDLGRNSWRQKHADASQLPSQIRCWWKQLLDASSLPLWKVRESVELCTSLLQVCATADEASAGAGIDPLGRKDEFDRKAKSLLTNPPCSALGATLCTPVIHASKVRVLPKQHTPRSGMTIRSLTHHLALCTATHVTPSWYRVPASVDSHSLNILLLPWPREVLPAQFRPPSPSVGQLLNMPGRLGFFAFDPSSESDVSDLARATLARAKQLVGRVDGVVLPELALTTAQHAALRDKLMPEGVFLVCGVAEPSSTPDAPGQNRLEFDIPGPGPGAEPLIVTGIQQAKHHRWRLDRRQIVQYGLGARLDPSCDWWEHISLERRDLAFVTIRDWLTLCVLICEDLARQDPVADLVRAVGPNLVIALLMDGPQLPSRWPGRYATVLADDPGSSVLTLTSVGMVELCRPPPGAAPSRAVALWKDAKSGDAVQVELPKGALGVVLTITKDLDEEFSADGRSDDRVASYPTLSGIHAVVLDPSKSAF